MASNAWGHFPTFSGLQTSVGGYDCKFVDSPPDKLVCQICLLVAQIPHQVTCCGRVYCNACLNQHKRYSLDCPNCRKRGQDFPDIRGEYTLQVTLKEKECMLYNFPLKSLSLGEQEINALKVKCNNCDSKCDWVGELRSLDNQLKMCGYALFHCPNKCMKNKDIVQLLHHDSDQHLKNKCPNRQHQCPHCKDTGRYCNITTTHLDTCPKLVVPCTNIGCNVTVSRCDLSDHWSKCQFEKVLCKYAEIGCKEKPLHKDLQQHENDDTFHLHLAIETVNKQQQELKAFKAQQERMNDMAGQAGRCVLKMYSSEIVTLKPS